MSHRDGDGFQSTPERDREREQAERDALPARSAAAAQARADTQAAIDANHHASEMADIEGRVRLHFVGTPEQWEAEKAGLIQAERHRQMQEAEARAKRSVAAQYQ